MSYSRTCPYGPYDPVPPGHVCTDQHVGSSKPLEQVDEMKKLKALEAFYTEVWNSDLGGTMKMVKVGRMLDWLITGNGKKPTLDVEEELPPEEGWEEA